MGFLGRIRFLGRNPLTIVELIIGIFSVVGGLYVISPLLQYSTVINGASPIIAMLSNPIAIFIYGAFYLISGFLTITGVVKRNYTLRSWGMFTNILIRTYSLMGTFFVQGILPLTWINSLIVLLIAMICYVVIRGFMIRGISE